MAYPNPEQHGDSPQRRDRDARERDLVRELHELSGGERSPGVDDAAPAPERTPTENKKREEHGER
jgi:hypothetical protein